jgi:hypothetical protein
MSKNEPAFDFSEALTFPVDQRLGHCVEVLKQYHQKSKLDDLFDLPLIPPIGATATEIKALEESLGVILPEDYRRLLHRWRYLIISLAGETIRGFSYNGVYPTSPPFIMDNLSVPGRYLVIGDYWRFADGDQLMVRLDAPDQPVVLFLHEDGPRVEFLPRIYRWPCGGWLMR